MFSERLYRWLLKLYPEEFRLDYSSDLAHAFREQCRSQGAARTWAEIIPDLTLSAWKEHMDLLVQDFRYSLRLLAKNKLLSAVAVLSVALAIGANSAMFSVVYTALLRPLAYRDSERLVMLWGSRVDDRSNRNGVAVPDFRDYRQSNLALGERGAFERMELFGGDRFANIQSDGRAERTLLQYVTPGFFDMLGTKPLIGRYFTDEEVSHNVRNAVISYGYWQRRYGGAMDVLGKTIVVNGAVSQITAVLPKGFGTWRDDIDVWLPLVAPWSAPGTAAGRKVVWQTCIARLRRGVTLQQAQAQMDGITTQLAAAYPETNAKRAVVAEPLGIALRDNSPDVMFPLFGAVGFVLLIACTNVTNLLLARGAMRRKEIALRAAIGAGRARLMRQLLMDGMVLAIPAGLLGLAAAQGCIALFKATVPPGFAYLDLVRLDWRVVTFTAAVALLVGILMGFAPALQFSRPNLTESLKDGGKGMAGGRHRGRSLLVVGQVALAGILLAGAGMTLSAVSALLGMQSGFNTENTLTMHIHVSGPQYTHPAPKRDTGTTAGRFDTYDLRVIDARVETFYSNLMTKVRGIPGVRTASFSSWIPKSYTGEGKRDRDFEIEERPTEPNRPRPNASMYNMVSPEYLETLRIPLQRGRFLSEHDVENAPWVAVINETLARKYFPGEDPIGKRITVLTVPEERPREIVGIIGDIRDHSLEPKTEMYVSFLQQPNMYPGYGTQPRLARQLAIRTGGSMAGIADTVQRAVRELDAGQLVFDVKTMQQRIAEKYDQETFLSVFIGAFASLALLLAAIGIYGVMTYTVAQRRHEIGIRMALGADRTRVLWMVLGQGMKLTMTGLMIAMAVAAALSKVLAWLTFGVKADPSAYFYAAATLCITALAAAAIPSRRATSVDAAQSLRCD
jgi:putative ABC transport system permease protein